jgi:uncharacterized membrane protein YjjP (DUF1212 family)
MIEQAPRSAPAPVAAASVIMRVPGVAVLERSAAKMSSVVVVVSMRVVSMLVVHVFLQMQFRYIE